MRIYGYRRMMDELYDDWAAEQHPSGRIRKLAICIAIAVILELILRR